MVKASIARKKRITMEVRQEVVFNLKMQGLTDREIVIQLREFHGVTASHVTVNGDWHRAYVARQRENDEKAQEFFDLMNGRYERIIRQFWPQMLAGSIRAADVIGRQLMALRKLNGLDREIGDQVTPYEDYEEYDYGKLTDEELDQWEALADKAVVTHIEDARQRFAQ